MSSYDPSRYNVQPYYDDFNPEKKYLRILFKPGYAVQARELTQIQSALQYQIDRFGAHIFENGSSVIDSKVTENKDINFVRINSILGISGSDNYKYFDGLTFSISGSSNTIGKISNVIAPTVSDPYSILCFSYISGTGNVSAGNTISANYNDTILTATVTGPSGKVSGKCSVVNIDSGIRYVDGFFVYHDTQKITPFSLSGSYREFENISNVVGFNIEKSFVTSESDNTLTDPAQGSYNYAAPGADRLKIDLTLVNKQISATGPGATSDAENFIEVLRIVDGVSVKLVDKPIYSIIEETLERRTYDESGNYTVRPFVLDGARSSGVSADKLAFDLSPGKAYIFGKEFETIAKETLVLDRARGDGSFLPVVSSQIDLNQGNTIKVVQGSTSSGFSTLYDIIREGRDVLLSSGASGSAFSQIGSAKIKDVSYNSSGNFDLFLYDVRLTGPSGSTNLKRVFFSGATGATQAKFLLTTTGDIQNPSGVSLLYRYPRGELTKSIDTLNYSFRRTKKLTGVSGTTILNPTSNGALSTFVTNSAIFEFDGNQVGSLNNNELDIFVFKDNGELVPGTYTINIDRNEIAATASSSLSSDTLFVSVLLKTKENYNTFRSKSSVTASAPLSFTSDGVNVFAYLNYDVDAYRLLSVTSSTGSDVTPKFTLDNGQKSYIYDWSRLIVTDTANITVGSTGYNATYLKFTRGTEEGPFTVNSYPSYDNIPTFTDPLTLRSYNLANYIDFRPDRGSTPPASGLTGLNLTTSVPFRPAGEYNTSAEYDIYLPRTDRIVLRRDKKFDIVKGTYSEFATLPEEPEDSMTLYTVRFNPYTYDEKDLTIRYVDNKRYTMKDIGVLEKRINNLEYYTTLSLLEEDAKNLVIRDAETGLDRFKNGILVDNFAGHSIGDVLNRDYKCSMDFLQKELRPRFKTRNVKLELSTNTTPNIGSSVVRSDDGLLTLAYTSEELVSQTLASKTTNVNPYNVINFTGTLKITPSSDDWVDTDRRPTSIINFAGQADTLETDNFSFTEWNDWQTNWFGVSTFTDVIWGRDGFVNIGDIGRNTVTTTNQTRTGVRTTVNNENVSRNIGDRVVNVGIVPFIRSQTIQMSVEGMKPNTRIYAFFDGTAITVTGPSGTTLITDNNGNLSGMTYTIPAGTFRTGERLIRFTDSPTNTPSTAQTTAEATYRAQGLLQTVEDTVISTRVSSFRRQNVTEDRNVTNTTRESIGVTWRDPLAQTFLVDQAVYPEGIFINKVGLYFATKSQNIPVTVEIRPTVNGYPDSTRIIPLAQKTLLPSEVTTSTIVGDSVQLNETQFNFSSPIYLPPGEYAIVIIANTQEYEVYTAEIGQPSLDTGIRINTQPYNGSLFKSQNASTWTASQTEDLTFKLYRCKFNTRSPGALDSYVTLQNKINSSLEENFNYHVYRVNTTTLQPSETYFTTENIESTEISINANENINYNGSIFNSSGNEIDIVRLNLYSNKDNVSPVIDEQRLSINFIENIINNNTISLVGSNDPETYSSISTYMTQGLTTQEASARYITRMVQLDDSFKSKNISVKLTVSDPRNSLGDSTKVRVYIKYQTPEDFTPFDDKSYVELTPDTTKIASNEDSFVEKTYKLANDLTDSQSFTKFQIKVVMYGSPDYIVPRIKDLRAIAVI